MDKRTIDYSTLEKAELHCHLDGLLNRQRLIRAGLGSSGEPYEWLAEQLGRICPVDSITDWLENYYGAVETIVSNNGELLLRLLVAYVEELFEQNVTYAEIFLTSFLNEYAEPERERDLLRVYRRTVDDAIERAAQAGISGRKPRVEFVWATRRTPDRADFMKRADRIVDFYRHGLITGVAFAGLEIPNTIRPYADWFNEFKRLGMGIEIHAGEWQGPESVWEALEYGHPDRIGHGLSAFSDQLLVKYLKEHDIHVEMCPTSNIILSGVKSIREHPIGRAIEENMNFSINTDDPGPLGCDITREHELVGEAFGLNEKDFGRIYDNAVRSSFAGRYY